jgi:hypothetical protein
MTIFRYLNFFRSKVVLMSSAVRSGKVSRSQSRGPARPKRSVSKHPALSLPYSKQNDVSITLKAWSDLSKDTPASGMTDETRNGLLAKVSKKIDEMMEKIPMTSEPVVPSGVLDAAEDYWAYRSMTERPHALTEPIGVKDVVALAHAGVTMTAKDVRELMECPAVMRANPVEAPKFDPFDMSMEDRIIHRWHSTLIRSSSERFGNRSFEMRDKTFEGSRMPFTIGKVFSHGDKHYVFVQKHNSEPVVIEDSAEMFPSDTLMAALLLLVKNHPTQEPTQQGVTQAEQAPVARAGGNASGPAQRLFNPRRLP